MTAITRGIRRLPSSPVSIVASESNWNPITGMDLMLEAGLHYFFRATVMADVAAATSGLAIGFAANATTAPTRSGWSIYMPTSGTANDGGGWSGWVTTASTTGGPTLPTTVAATTGNIVLMEGFVVPAVSQLITLQIKGEETSDITVRSARFEWEIQP